MTNLNQYSFQDSKFKILDQNGQKVIQKETRLNPQLKTEWNKLFQQILNYVDTLKKADIPLPKIRETDANEERILFICDYKGPNILQSLDSSRPETLFDKPETLDQVLTILKKAQDSKIHFDPHIKNFVTDNDKVYYVDFTPPWNEDYFELRLSLGNKQDREILVPFFGCMHPDVLGYHFAADFMKMDNSYREIMPSLFAILKKKELVEGTFEEFIQKASEIIKKERLREKEGTFLL